MMRPRRWASSWREPNCPEIWMATLASGRSIEKLATLDTISTSISPERNASKRSSRTFWEVLPVISGAPSRSATVAN